MTPLLLSALVLTASPEGERPAAPEVVAAPTSARLLTNEVAAALGVQGTAFTVHGGRLGDTLFAPTVSARGVWSGFTVDGGLLVAAPLTRNGEVLSLSGLVRAGWTGQRWSAVGGLHFQWANGAPTNVLLPSIRGQVDFGAFGLSAGLFDFYGQVPFHLSVELGRFSLGYVAPLGLVASADIPLTGAFSLRCQGYVYQLGNSQQMLVTVGAVWGGGK